MVLTRSIELPTDNRVASIFTRETDPTVAIAHGYGVRVGIWNNQLEISDGIGKHRRTRKFPKADRELERLAITGQEGYITLGAMRWCNEHGVSITVLNSDGDLVASHAAEGPGTVALLRSQVAATADSIGLEIARELIARKLSGQASNILRFTGDLDSQAKINRHLSQVESCETIAQLMASEGFAAREYFDSWQGIISIKWDSVSMPKIPTNWIQFSGRGSQLNRNRTKYNASDPINALLNYAYTLGYNESRLACIAHGLDPRIGFIHSDKAGRDSLTYDLLETLRPTIDRYVVDLIRSRQFNSKDFIEPRGYEPGTCRIVAPLTHEIIEHSYSWHKPASEATKLILSIITGHSGKRGDHLGNVKREKQEFMSATVTVDEILPPKLWTEVEPLIPSWPGSAKYRAPISDRTIVAAMLYMERARKPWAYIPGSFGVSYRTMNDRRRMWQHSGHWPAIQAKLRELV